MLTIIALFLGSAVASTALTKDFEIAESGLRVFWRDGNLVVAPPKEDPRPAIRPLAGFAPIQLPDDMSGWLQLGPECTPKPSLGFDWEGQAANAVWNTSTENAFVDIKVGDVTKATATMGRPLEPCRMVTAEADGLPGLELLLLWTAPGPDDSLFGLTVFRLPPLVSP